MSRSTFFADSALAFAACLAVALAAFLLVVGLGPHSLPFAPGASYSDAVTTHWPSALFLRRSVLEEHTWPLWRGLLMSGQPFAANPLNKVWYPPQWLVFLLPPVLHLNVMVWLHLLIGGVGAFAWGRSSGLMPIAAALVGTAYAFAPRLSAALGAGHLDLLYAAAWVPWLLWSLERAVRANPPRGAWAWLGVIAALCILADIRLSFYAGVLAAAYALYLLAKLSDRRARTIATVQLVLGGLLAAALSAFQWVPLLLYRDALSRGRMSLEDAALHSLSAGQWLGLIIGDHGGGWETLVYVGVSTLALASVAVLLRPRPFAFWGAALLVLALYAMGDHFPLWTGLNRAIPALRWWRVPPRVWLLAALILPYLAGWGAQILATAPPHHRAARLATVGLLGAGAACGLFSTLALREQITLSAALGVFALPLAALVMALALTRRLPPRAILALFALVVVADGLWIDRALVEGRLQREWLDRYRPLAEALQADGALRVYSPTYSLPQQAAAYWDLAQFGGIDPLQMASYAEAAEAATGVRAPGYSVTIPAFQVDDEGESEAETLARANRGAHLDVGLLGQWLVTHVVAAYPLDDPALTLIDRIDGAYVYRNRVAPAVHLTWRTPNEARVVAEQPVSEPLYAVAAGRWNAASDAPGLPGTPAEAGQAWTFTYDPSEIGVSARAAALLLLLTFLVWQGFGRA